VKVATHRTVRFWRWHRRAYHGLAPDGLSLCGLDLGAGKTVDAVASGLPPCLCKRCVVAGFRENGPELPREFMVVGALLREMRKRAGLALPEAGRLTGRDHRTLSDYECGKSRPCIFTWLRLAMAYGADPSAATAELVRRLENVVQVAKGRAS
jgi:hypothetical protein